MITPTITSHVIGNTRFDYKLSYTGGWKIDVFINEKHVTSHPYKKHMSEKTFVSECQTIQGWINDAQAYSDNLQKLRV